MSPLQRQILDYLYADIAVHGGRGRRLSKINLHVESDTDGHFSRAIEGLRHHGLIAVEEVEGFPFIYAVPLHSPLCHCNLCIGAPQGMPSEEVTPFAPP